MTELARLADVAEVLPGLKGPWDFDNRKGRPHFVQPQPGDIRVILLGETEAMVFEETSLGSGYAGGVTLRVKAHHRLLPSWLLAWGQSQHFQNQIPKNLPYSVGLRATARFIAEFSIPLPDLTYQQQLMTHLAPLDAASAAMQEMSVDLFQLRRAEADLAVARALSDCGSSQP